MQVTAKSNIKHDGQRYEAGQSFEVSENQAADLLAAGVIESVKGVKPARPTEAPDRSLDTPEDKKSQDQETEVVAGLAVNKKMTKEKLRGIALAMGLEVPKEAVKDEIYELIVEKRGGQEDLKNQDGDKVGGDEEVPTESPDQEDAPADDAKKSSK
jgi:hypothetical protein